MPHPSGPQTERMSMKKRTGFALAGAAIVMAASPAVPVAADDANEAPEFTLPALENGKAMYNGEVIDLKQDGWDRVQGCTVYEDRKAACFDSVEEADRHAEGYVADPSRIPEGSSFSKSARAPKAPCHDADRWLYLFSEFGSDVNYGDWVRFRDKSVTQNLSPWGFNNRNQSFSNSMACNASGYSEANGGGAAYQYMWGVSKPYYNSGNFTGAWNKAMSSIRIHAYA